MKINVNEIIDLMPERNNFKLQFNDLIQDIKQNGLIEPIVFNQRKELLAGRRRLKALKELGVVELEETKHFVIRETKDKLHDFDIFLSENIKRQDLTDVETGRFLNQRKVLYEELHPETKQGQAQAIGMNKKLKHNVTAQSAPTFINETAKQYGKSERWVSEKIQAIKILEEEPELEKLESAKKIIRTYNKEKQRKELEKTKIQQPTGTFDVIVIDPPWEYGDQYDDKGNRGTVDYPTMTQEQLKQIKLPTKKDCVLWLWVTNGFIKDAYELLEEWGFEAKSFMTWNKVNMGTGRWLRNVTEHCILAIKGKPFFDNKTYTTLLTEKRTGHSIKPESFYTMVDKICAGRKLDYFARKPREDWEVYGDEVI